MSTDSLKRKLTAILYTDVAGYSRLTGGDEEGTHRRVMEVLDFASAQIEAKPDLSISFLENNMPTKHAGGLDPYLNGLRKSGLE